jgi:hypothetical protein
MAMPALYYEAIRTVNEILRTLECGGLLAQSDLCEGPPLLSSQLSTPNGPM